MRGPRARRTTRVFILTTKALTIAALASCYADARIGAEASDAGGAVDGPGRVDASTADASLPADAAPAQLAGAYDLLLKEGDNGCALTAWTVGSVSSANVVLMQADRTVHAEITGLAAVTFGLLLGTSKLDGTIAGDALALNGTGVTQATFDGGACPYTFDAVVDATVRADRLEDGVILYRRNFAGNAACAPYACTTTSSFVGLRNDVDP